MYFVGDSGTILHFDGSLWTKMASGTREEIDAIYGTSDNNIWAAGYGGHNHTVLLHYDGTSWTIDPISSLPTAQTGGFGSVWCTDSAGHHITIASNSLVYRKKDANPWRSSDSGKVPNYTSGYIGVGVIGNSVNDFFAIGGYGLICHWNGRDWYRYDQFFEPGNPSAFTGDESVKGNTICIVGQKNGTSYVLIGQRK